MRTHMYAASYANFEQARATFEEIPARASLGELRGAATVFGALREQRPDR